MKTPRCQATNKQGLRCSAPSLKGSTFCFFHDPAATVDRAVARRMGGQMRNRRAATLGTDERDLPLKNVGDVVALLGASINQVRRGELDPRVGNAVGYLSGLLLKAIEQGDLEKRIGTLENVVSHQSPMPSSDTDSEPDFAFVNPAA